MYLRAAQGFLSRPLRWRPGVPGLRLRSGDVYKRQEGHCPQLLQNLLEVRGLGLLDIRTIFGETSVRRKMRLKLIVHLVRATAQDKFERLPLQDITQDMLGLPVRKVMLQVAAGRNLAVLVEAAVRNTILKLRGIDTLGEFMERQAMAILQSSK